MAVDLNEFCKTIQKKLNAQAIRDDNSIAPDQGTLAYLNSSENKSANKFQANFIDTGDGKKREGRVRFLPRGTKADYDAPINGDICTPGGTVGYKKQEFQIDETTNSVKLTFSYNEMRSFCEGKDEHIAEVLYSRMKAYRSILNKKIVEKIVAGGFIGNFANGVAGPKALPLFHTTDSRINPVGEITFEQDMTDAELTGMRPRLIGANLLQSYASMKKIQCCNLAGYNAGELAQVDSYFLDKTVDSVLGTTSNILALVPGALQLITTNYNAGDFKIIHPDHSHTTIADTLIPGLVYDLYTHMIKCDGSGENDVTFVIQWKCRWTLWGYPSDLFGTSDELSGVKDVYLYQAQCSDDNVCALAGQKAAPVAVFSQSLVGTDLTLDATASAAQAPGAALVSFIWDFGGTTGVKSGAPGSAIVGVAGISGNYDSPVIDTTTANVGSNICLTVVDDNLNESVKFCDDIA